MLLLPSASQAQETKPIQFKDYPYVENIDSLEAAVQSKKSDSEAYLNGLITLEKNRIDYIGWFGNDLSTIKELAHKFRSPMAMACYHYFEGVNLREINLGEASRNTMEAIRYFESTKDTAGIIAGYYELLIISSNSKFYGTSKIHSPQYYYDGIMQLSEKSSRVSNKLMRIRTMLTFEKAVKGEQNFDRCLIEIEKALLLLNSESSLVKAQMNVAFSTFYNRNDKNKVAIAFDENAHDLYKSLSSKIPIKFNFNFAVGQISVKNYAKAKILVVQAIEKMEEIKIEKRDYKILFELHSLLLDLKYIENDYDGMKSSIDNVYSSAQIRYKVLRNSLFQEFKTQQDIQQKETENKLLKLENEVIESRNAYFIIVIAIGFVSFIVVSILLILLYKSNSIQKKTLLFKDQLFAIIGHDLRSPITAFEGVSESLDFLIRKKEYESIPALGASIDKSLFSAKLLLDNLLDWYSMQTVNASKKTSKFFVNDLIEEIQHLYENIAKNQQKTVEIDIIDTPAIVGDRNAMLSVIRNLLDNALKHGKSKRVLIKAYNRDNNTVIEVITCGTLLSTERLSVLQQQIKNNSFTLNGGHGLGLYMVSYFVSKHKGQLSIESSKDEGTTFKIQIPIS